MHPCLINVRSKHSLIHIGSLDSFDITEGGKAAAGNMLAFFETGDIEFLNKAVIIYDRIIPNENFGGEYTALQWFCRLILAPENRREEFLGHPNVKSWYQLLARDDFQKLKEYLTYKYHFKEIGDKNSQASRDLRFLEDFILFQNPDRMRWENTEEYLRWLAIPRDAVIADLGCGPGYYTFKFADIVGPGGRVYAIETNPMHLDYLHGFIREYGTSNVEVITGGMDGIGLKPGITVDLVFMCSLYHVIYAALTEDEKQKFIGSIKGCLRENGRLVVLDNDVVAEGDLPYHGPYIAKSLIVSQLYHYGFRLADQYQLTPQRYALVFQLASQTALEAPALPGKKRMAEDEILQENAASLVIYRIAEAAPTAGFTPAGQKAAELFLAALESHSEAAAVKAQEAYDILIPLERIGDEYTAFAWFCQYLRAGEAQRAGMLRDRIASSFFELLGRNDFDLLKRYVKTKYELADSGDEAARLENLTQISEYITFNNPNRDRWEKTDEMLRFIDVKKGERIADVGCGSGFFTYRFAQAVGSGGLVYATEINRDALVYVEELRDRSGLPIETVTSRLNDLCLPADSVDTVFMCSMYHAVYIASIEYVKDDFIASVKRALRKGGRLIVVDNEITPPGIPPYFGSAIARELVVAQLSYYGFRLRDSRQFIPQRYVLVFEEE